MPEGDVRLSGLDDATDHRVVGQARTVVAERLRGVGRGDLVDEAELVVSELVTNALLHGGGCTGVGAVPTDDGVRLEVGDRSHVPPILGHATAESMTGRGLRSVATIATSWGVRQTDDGKVVWAEVSKDRPGVDVIGEDELLAMWGAEWGDAQDHDRHVRYRVSLGDVPTNLLLDAKAHVDNLIREFTLAAVGASVGVSGGVPSPLASLIEAVAHRFAEARMAIKHQALEAASCGSSHTRLELNLPLEAADAGEEYLLALDEADAYCRAVRLLTLETPPQHRVFRRWYVQELVTQLRAAAAGRPLPAPQSFEERLLQEIDAVTEAQRPAERAARLYTAAVALAGAGGPEAVADAALNEGVAALGASGGALLMAAGDDHLDVPGTVGYDEGVVARLRSESANAELPAAVALRTGQPVWIESVEERDGRFPELFGFERSTVAMCAVPLIVQGRRLGAMRFSFGEPRLFDDDERRFVLALAAQTAQAMDRAKLQHDRLQVSQRLQRSLLPPHLPPVPGVDVAAVYQPLGDGVEVGGDFYDLWPIAPRRWGLAIGDAVGTGPEAAALTALVRHTLRALAMSEAGTERVLRSLNDALLGAASDSSESFCTVLFAVLSLVGDEVHLQIASGGHPYPILRHADGSTEELPLGGSLLGSFADVEVATLDVVLGAGDTMVFVTDGVLEAHREGAFFDVEGVHDVLSHSEADAASVATALERAVLRHCRGHLGDDMAALVLHVAG